MKKTFVIPDSLLRKILDLSQKQNVSQSRVVSDLLALGMQKQNVLDTARALEQTKLKADIVSEFKDALDDAKNSLALNTTYRIEKLEDRIDELSDAVSEMQRYETVWRETLYISILVKKFSANAFAGAKLSQQRIDEIKQETKTELEQFISTLPEQT